MQFRTASEVVKEVVVVTKTRVYKHKGVNQ
jgi:hypothetical protein